MTESPTSRASPLLRLALYLWCAPTTAPGLLLALAAWLTGGGVRRKDGVLEAEGGLVGWLLARLAPVPGGVAALTLGHVVLARDRAAHEWARTHERVHVRQAERWGPLFLPAYLTASLVAWLRGRHPYGGNRFEREAFALAGEVPPVPPARIRRHRDLGPLLLFLATWPSYGLFLDDRDHRDYSLQHASVEALAERGTYRLGDSQVEAFRQPGDTFHHQGSLFAGKQPGQAAIGALPYLVLSRAGITYRRDYDLAARLVTWLSASLLAALGVAALFSLAHHRFGLARPHAYLAALAFGLATPMLPYAGVEHHDAMATALSACAFLAVETGRGKDGAARPGWCAAGGLLSGLVLFSSALPVAVVAALSVYALFVLGRRGVPAFLAGLAAGLLPSAAFNWHYFGNPLTPPGMVGGFRDTYPQPSCAGLLEKAWTYLGSGQLGLGKHAPIVLAGMAGIFALPAALAAQRRLLAAAVLLHLGFVFSIETVGHCQYGPRYLLPLLPFACLGLAPLGALVARAGRLRLAGASLIGVLFAHSFLVNAVGAMYGTMYCGLDRFAFLRYLEDHGRRLTLVSLGWRLAIVEMLLLALLVHELRRRRPAQPALAPVAATWTLSHSGAAALAALAGAIVYFASCPDLHSSYDYTWRVAQALFEGRLGLTGTPPGWLNELVPRDGMWYSVFPLGAVLSTMPLALFAASGRLAGFPAALFVALLGAASGALGYGLTLRRPDLTGEKRAALVIFLLFGNWHWANLVFRGAWQVAIGIAVLGELGAIYYTLVRPRPLLAGLGFALAFGNRTELLVLAPLLLWLLRVGLGPTESGAGIGRAALVRAALRFCLVPFILGCLTLAYNQARFGAPWDFGYAHIPGVLQEPWYEDGIFSLSAIPRNAREMLLTGWRRVAGFPYLVPTGFGGSILISSPFLLLLLRRRRGQERRVVAPAWIAVLAVTLVLWCHGNPGGWQFSYRYAAVLLPWMLLLLVEKGGAALGRLEVALLALSVGISAWGMYLFNWSGMMKL